MAKFYNYKGFKVEELEWPHEPEVFGGKVYRFCDDWETIFQKLGVANPEELTLSQLAEADIFSPLVKGIAPEENLPELDLTYWPRTASIDYGIVSFRGPDTCRFPMPFIVTKKDVERYGEAITGIYTDHSFCQDGKYGIMDADGAVKIPAIYDEIKCICWYDDDSCQESQFVARKDRKWGKIGFQNNKPCECKYDSIKHIGNFAPDYYYGDVFLVESDGRMGLCIDDKVIMPLGEVPVGITEDDLQALADKLVKENLGNF